MAMRSVMAMTAAVLAVGCGDRVDNDPVPVTNAAATARPAPAAARPPAGPEPAVAPDSAQAAADVVRRYYAALDRKRYAQAHALWEPQAANANADRFAAGFARYASYHGEVGTPGRIDSGAGQRYVTVPVRVFGRTGDGEGFAESGDVVLHRTADIDGATADQRRWRIRSIDLKPE